MTATLLARGHRFDSVEHGVLRVHDLAPPEIGDLAAANDILIEEMSTERVDLDAAVLAVSEQIDRS